MTNKELSVTDKLKALYNLQLIDSELDKIAILKGELPMEVKDLEDEVIGLETRESRLLGAIDEIKQEISGHIAITKESEALIGRYKKQLDEVRNDREYKALTKEMENADLDIKLAKKRIGDAEKKKDARNEVLQEVQSKIEELKEHLDTKRTELDKIIEKTEKEEKKLMKASAKASKGVEKRLFDAYKRIRGNYRNGQAVVTVDRDACGGCFNKVPPQIQLELSQRKKIIACEHCGRVLVDKTILE